MQQQHERDESLVRAVEFMASPMSSFVMKNRELAARCREDGDKLFKAKLYYDAIVKYNQSLCYSRPLSSDMGVAYANRSAAYFECHLYDLCAENIELALECDCPEDKRRMLSERLQRCGDILSGAIPDPNPHKVKYDIEDELELKFQMRMRSEPNPTIPFIAKSLRQHFNPRSNRKFVASDVALKVGEIIADEAGFNKTHFMLSSNNSQFQHCAECLSENKLNLKSCDFCLNSMFCSKRCHDEMTQFHQNRCDVFFNQIDYRSPQVAALKFFVKALKVFGTIEKLEEFVIASDGKVSTIFDFDFSDSTKNDENYVKLMINSMPKGWHDWKLTKDGFGDQRAMMNHTGDIFFTSPAIKPLLNTHKGFIKMFLERSLKIVLSQSALVLGFSGFELGDHPDNAEKYQRAGYTVVGAGFSGLYHALDHSCSPNTHQVCLNGRKYHVVLRPIAVGEEITTMKYLPSWRYTKSERIQMAKDSNRIFNFTCKCFACKFNYPTREEAKILSSELFEVVGEHQRNISHALNGWPHMMVLDMDEFCRKYEELFTIKDFPCREFIIFEQAIHQLNGLKCKMNSVWPLMRRSFYDQHPEVGDNWIKARALDVDSNI